MEGNLDSIALWTLSFMAGICAFGDSHLFPMITHIE